MKKVLHIILSLTGFIIFLSACSERMTIELDSTYTRLVVYGEITNVRKVHSIKLSKSSDYYSNIPPAGVTGASVSIFDDKTEYILNESSRQPGVYETNSNFTGVSGKTYRLKIENVDINGDGMMESYSASSYLPPVANIDSIKLSYISNSFISGWQILLYAMDPANTKDFYISKVFKNGKLQTDTLSEYFFRSDELFNGSYTNGIVSQFLSDYKANEKVSRGDTIMFELDGITKEYYEFLAEAQAEIYPKTPLFSGPPANVKSNISNNALGFFTAYSARRAVIKIPSAN